MSRMLCRRNSKTATKNHCYAGRNNREVGRMSNMNDISAEIDDFIAKNGGNCRDALNVALARIEFLEGLIKNNRRRSEIMRRVRQAERRKKWMKKRSRS